MSRRGGNPAAKVAILPPTVVALRRPIYIATAVGGHFGRPEFPWERLMSQAAFEGAAFLGDTSDTVLMGNGGR